MIVGSIDRALPAADTEHFQVVVEHEDAENGKLWKPMDEFTFDRGAVHSSRISEEDHEKNPRW